MSQFKIVRHAKIYVISNYTDNHAITKPNHKISLVKYDIPETDKDKEKRAKLRAEKNKKPIDKNEDKNKVMLNNILKLIVQY